MVVYTLNEAAGLLKLCRRTLSSYIGRGELGHFRVGRAIRITQEDLEVFVAKMAVKPPYRAGRPRTVQRD